MSSTFSMIFMPCSKSLRPLYLLQARASPFLLKSALVVLYFQLSGILLSRAICWRAAVTSFTPTPSIALNISADTPEGPVALLSFILLIAVLTSSSAMLSIGPSTTSHSSIWFSYSSFSSSWKYLLHLSATSFCSTSIFPFSSLIKPLPWISFLSFFIWLATLNSLFLFSLVFKSWLHWLHASFFASPTILFASLFLRLYTSLSASAPFPCHLHKSSLLFLDYLLHSFIPPPGLSLSLPLLPVVSPQSSLQMRCRCSSSFSISPWHNSMHLLSFSYHSFLFSSSFSFHSFILLIPLFLLISKFGTLIQARSGLRCEIHSSPGIAWQSVHCIPPARR